MRKAVVLDVEGIAEHLGLSVETIEEHIERGDLAMVAPTSEPTIHQADLHEFLAECYPNLVNPLRLSSRTARARRRLASVLAGSRNSQVPKLSPSHNELD